MKEYLQKEQEVLKALETSEEGLSAEQAAERIEKYGKNRLKEGKKETILQKFVKELLDPMIIILIIAAAISGVTAFYANESFTDVFIILFVVIVNAILGVYQESKAEKAIAALQEITASTSKVIRNQKIVIVKSEELVPGDIVLLEAGDAVPADARILECASLKIEEAALTGESVPVTKTHEVLSKVDSIKEVPLGDRTNMVYMGSTVVYGRGKVVIVSTGMETEMGKIATALTNAKEGQTPLQRKLNQLSKILSFLVLGICAVIFAVDLIRHANNLTGEVILNTFMVAVSLAVAAIPEGLAAVVTIVLSIGVTKMSKRNAVIRKLTAVETLGCAQIICSDKTGTLTQNKMTVVQSETDNVELLATAMSLCSDAELDENNQAIGEPTECALVNFAFKENLNKNQLKKTYPRVDEAPFDSMRKMMSTVHQKENQFIQFTKGAPDEVIKCCTRALINGKVVKLTDKIKEDILKNNKEMADQALRVLCAAYKEYGEKPIDNSPKALEQDLIYIGLTGMIDPIRPEVKSAIEECKEAGIKVVMITGDHRDTAIAIALQLGIIESKDEALTGTELDDISDEEFAQKVKQYSVYARVQPEHKVRIVTAWKAMGKVTAMTGDGVNDAPSIKNADIGIGMGITGTDVTKNVADMVLADDNFATIVLAVEEGRRIYDNIRKSIQFLLASNLAEVLAIFAATLMGFTILQPVHLLWINLVTDTFPALALGMEKAEDDIMQRAPRDSKEGIFAGKLGVDVAWQGTLLAALTVIAYFVGHFIESGKFEIASSPDGVTMAFLTLSMAEIFHSFNMRSRRKSVLKIHHPNKFLWIAMIASLVATTLVIYVPFLSDAFGFEHIDIREYFVALAIAFSVIPIVEIVKMIQRKVSKTK